MEKEKEKNTRFAFDLGGVIIQRGALENFLIQESKVSVKLTVQKFGSQNVFIISKAKQKYIDRNIQLLKNHNFFQITGFLQKNVYFVNQYQDKGPLGQKLKINYILDNSIKVAKNVLQYGIQSILFGNHYQFLKENKNFINCKNWKQFRRLLEKIKA